jgi:flagellar biosynthesis/type III secretory pathway chaperone
MVMETGQRADNPNDIDPIIESLTRIVEREVQAFTTLLEALEAQQASIVQGDTEAVSVTTERVENLVGETRNLEQERWGQSIALSKRMAVEQKLTLTALIPMVEKKYADRLDALRSMLVELAERIRDTNEHNRRLLAQSLDFVDRSLRTLTENRNPVAYSKKGLMQTAGTSMYRGLG